MRSQRISVVSVHPLTEWTILPFPSQPKLVLIYRPRRDGGLSWPGSWLHIEINVRHRELNPVTFTHLCYCRRHYTSYKSPYTASVIQPSIVSTFLRPVYRAPDLFTSASEDAYFGKTSGNCWRVCCVHLVWIRSQSCLLSSGLREDCYSRSHPSTVFCAASIMHEPLTQWGGNVLRRSMRTMQLTTIT